MAQKTFGHAALLADLHQFTHHQNQRERLRKAIPVVILAPRNRIKSLQKAVESYTGTPIKHRARPTRETRQASAEELRAKLAQLLDRAAVMFESKEITGLQLSEFEAHINRALDGMARKA